jgi:shikimate dehydrogenase
VYLIVTPSLIPSGTTQLLGIMGDPVRHSLSPIMQNAALRVMGLDYLYVPFPVIPAQLPQAVTGLAALGVKGFNVTIPHKQAILTHLDSVTPIAQAIGAVNTVWREGGRWQGTNTDVQGFISPLQTLGGASHTALVLGYGGSARAVVMGCHQLGFRHIYVAGRQPQKLQDFIRSWQGTGVEGVEPVLWDSWQTLLPTVDLVVNSTPLGMAPKVEHSPLTPADLEPLPSHAILYDLIYTPCPTRLLQFAQQRGLRTIDGTEMLVQQGAAALEIWTAQSVPVAVMREALHHALSIH